MRKVFLLIVSMLLLSPLYGQNRAASTVTVEQAVTLLEEQFDVSIIFNPCELNGGKRVSLPAQRTNARQTLESMLGEEYPVSQHGAVLTIRYQPRPAVSAKEKAAPEAASAIAEPVALQDAASAPIREAEAEEPVALADDSIVPAEIPAATAEENVDWLAEAQELDSAVSYMMADTLSHPIASQADTAFSPSKDMQEKQRKPQVFYAFSPHRLFFDVTTGYGFIEGAGSVATAFDLSYAWFFHRNWGVSAGAGIDCYARRAETPEQSRITNAYFPISLQMEYPVSLRTSIISRLTNALELPIDGAYNKDETGERYNGNTLFLGVGGEVGVAILLVPQLSLGISLYGQSIVASAGNINQSYTDQGVYPGQVGLAVSLRVNQWKKPARGYNYYARQKRH